MPIVRLRLCLLALLMLGNPGCGKPDEVNRFDSPTTGLFVTVETNSSIGPASADFTRIFVHLDIHGESAKELILDGHYLQHTTVIWLNPHEVTLCVPEGFTNTFRNHITLHADGITQTIQVHIREHC